MKTIGRTILHEIRVAIPAFVFFLVFFHMLAITRAVANNEMGLAALKASTATIGALLVAKSILIVESLPLARWFRGILFVNILWRTLLFGLVAFAFRVVEQAIEDRASLGYFKSFSEFSNQFLSPVVLVEVGWIAIAMFGFCLIAEYSRLLGGDLVWRILTHRRIERHETSVSHWRKDR